MKPDEARSWRRVAWTALPKGQPVRLSRDGQLLGCGVVDGTTPDGSIIWVVLDGWPERRMFHREDFIKVEIKGRPQGQKRTTAGTSRRRPLPFSAIQVIDPSNGTRDDGV